jgi:FdhD protein
MTVERIRHFESISHRQGESERALTDQVAVEEPLEIRLADEALAVIMRTPGEDMELAAGLLLAEEIIQDSDDIATIAHCRDAEDPELENIVNITLTPECMDRVKARGGDEKMKRTFLTSSSCGVCGKRSIETLHALTPPFGEFMPLDIDKILSFPNAMQAGQKVFDATGGIHAAAIFDVDGTLLVLREDIGRHNAVDKCVGSLVLTDNLPIDHCTMMVSGRTSFEVIQKALVAGIRTVAAVSAPSSLAIELARDSKINLCGFVRGKSLNVYAGRSLSNTTES